MLDIPLWSRLSHLSIFGSQVWDSQVQVGSGYLLGLVEIHNQRSYRTHPCVYICESFYLLHVTVFCCALWDSFYFVLFVYAECVICCFSYGVG